MAMRDTTITLTLFDKFEIQFSKDDSVLVLFDIDGVVCKSGHYAEEVNLSEEEYVELKKKSVCTDQFIVTANLIEYVNESFGANVDVKFITGRKENTREATIKMFESASLSRVADKVMLSNHSKVAKTYSFLYTKLFKVYRNWL